MGLSFSQLRQLRRLARPEHFPQGTLIFREWSPGEWMLVIRRGKVRVYKTFFGASQTLSVRGKGSVLGEMALLEDGPRAASVEAVTPVDAWVLDRPAAVQFLKSHPDAAVEMLATLSGRMRTTQQDLIEQLMQRNLELERALARLEARNRERTALQQSNRELTELATHDGLTGCLNRRALDEELKRWTADSEMPFALLMMDVDNFKHYNDTHGHQMGDRLLTTLASVINFRLRADDLMGRYGGEEFVVLFYGMRPQHSGEAAERVRASIADYPFPEAHRQPLGVVSVSAGLAHFPSEATRPEELLHLADSRLYQAKTSGRNRVIGP